MLIVAGKPEYAFCKTVINGLKELSGPYSVSYAAADVKTESGTEIRVKGFSLRVGWTILNTLATSKKKIEILESTESSEDSALLSKTNTDLPNICRIKLNLSPIELLVWADEAKRTTKWEITPPYIVLGHELSHAFRWVLGKFEAESRSFVRTMAPYLGEITLPSGKKETIKDNLNDQDTVAMALENSLRKEAKERGADIGCRAAYFFGRNPNTLRVFKI